MFHKGLTTAFAFSAVIWAQSPPTYDEFAVTGEVRSESGISSRLEVELYETNTHRRVDLASVTSDGGFRFARVAPGGYVIRVAAMPAGVTVLEEYRQLGRSSPPLILNLPPSVSVSKPVAGLVSLHELQHPIPKRAFKALAEAERYADANDHARAIAKLHEALRIHPRYRDAHTNLGAQYVRSGRLAEAIVEFQTAFEIGPDDAMIWSNYSWSLMASQQYVEAEKAARKALELAPNSTKARFLLGCSLAMQPGHEKEALRDLDSVAGEMPGAKVMISRVRERMSQR